MELERCVAKYLNGFLFALRAWPVFWPPVSRSSTYKLRRSSATISGSRSSQASKWASITPPSRKRDGARPNSARVKRSISNFPCSLFLQWNLNASRSHTPRIRICKKAFWMSPVTATGYALCLTSMSQSLFCNGGPG